MEFETLATGYGLLEGPRTDEQNRLYFSDIPNGGVFRRSPDGKIETLIEGRKSVGGIALNQDGGIVVTGRTLARWDPQSGKTHDLFAEWEGKPLFGINDLTIDDNGSIWFGTFGCDISKFDFKSKPPTGSLFRIDPPGKVTKLWDGVEVTNGLGFSPDRKLLYHCDSTTKAVWAYPVRSDRTVADRQKFAELPEGMPDGMTVDRDGGVWVATVAGRGEVIHYKADGTIVERIKIPAKTVTSVAFGGPDWSDLYVVTSNNDDRALKGTVFKARSEVPGLPVPKSMF
jgi:xylono-1,5-lactonase